MSDPTQQDNKCPSCGETVTGVLHNCPTGQLIHDRRKIERDKPKPAPISNQHVRGILKFWDEFEPKDAVTTEEMRRQFVESLMAGDILLRLATVENNLDLLAGLCTECRNRRGDG